MNFLFVLFLVLVGCFDIRIGDFKTETGIEIGAVDLEEPEDIDADGDGFFSTDDCDDIDSNIFPGADEYCNGLDDDCDGEIDEIGAVDAQTWYADFDGDGHGNSAMTIMACETTLPYVQNSNDCNDNDPSIYTDAKEICGNGIDENCDQVDPGC